MKRRMLACGVLVMAVSAAGVGWAQTKPAGVGGAAASAPGLVPLAVQLEQGIYQEETAGQLEAAAKTYGQIAAQGEATRLLAAQALYRLAVVEGKLKREAEAKAALEKLAALYPEQGDLIAKARGVVGAPPVVAANNNETKSEDVWNKSRAMHKEEVDALVAKGWQYLADRRYGDAGDAFEKANKLDGSSAAALVGMGYTELRRSHETNEPNRAEGYFKAALELSPRDALAWNGLGDFYNRSSRTQYGYNENRLRAVDAWTMAVDVDPTATGPMAQLGNVAATSGRYDEAVAWYEKVLKLDPKSETAKVQLKKVQETQAAIKDGMAVVKDFFKKLDAGQYGEAFGMIEEPFRAAPVARSGRLGGRGSAISTPPVEATAPATQPFEVREQAWEKDIRAKREGWGKVVSRRVWRGDISMIVDNGMSEYTLVADAGSARARPENSGGFGGGPNYRVPQPEAQEVRRVTISYMCEFQNEKNASETILVFKNEAGQWRVLEYSVGLAAKARATDPLKAP